jgi:hypothetical protein
LNRKGQHGFGDKLDFHDVEQTALRMELSKIPVLELDDNHNLITKKSWGKKKDLKN